jgi:hypothetical protein
MGHKDDGFGTVVDSIFDGREGSGDSLVVCDILVRVKWNVEVDLEHSQLRKEGVSMQGPTRIKTRLSLRSQSVMESLFDRDILGRIFRLRIEVQMDV